MKGVRCDALPEYSHYADTGCTLAPLCLDCPLPTCRYDLPGGLRTARVQERAIQMQALHAAGYQASEIATMLGVSRRTVFRLWGATCVKVA